MTIASAPHANQRIGSSAGIAIGPILFIIAVLGILASAIAAGSGSFTTSTTGEGNRAKASAIIEIGQTLKIGFDRILGAGVEFSTIVINTNNTSATVDLFSPTGGGVAAPSVTMAAAPATDLWYYPLVAIPGIGTATGSRLAVLRVTEGVCDEINVKTNAYAVGTATAAAADLGDLHDTALNATATTNWPSQFDWKPTGCVRNNGATHAGFYFYQVLGIQ